MYTPHLLYPSPSGSSSFARRQRELGTLKEQLEQLQAERDEAWRVAEDLANEMDERVYGGKEREGRRGGAGRGRI